NKAGGYEAIKLKFLGRTPSILCDFAPHPPPIRRLMKFSALERALISAWERKRFLHDKAGAVRLLKAQASGTAGVVFELYGKHGVLFDYGADLGAAGAPLRSDASRWGERCGWETVYLHDRTSAGSAGRAGHHALAGVPPETLVIVEDGLRFR